MAACRADNFAAYRQYDGHCISKLCSKGSNLDDIRVMSRNLLERTLDDFKPKRWSQQITNPSAARFAAETAALLGFDDLIAPFLSFAADLQVRDIAEVKNNHPIIDDQYLAKFVDPLADDDYKCQFRDCKNDYERECLLITLVLRGHMRLALRLSWRLPRYRRINVRFVAAIESFRMGRLHAAKRLLRSLPRSTMCIWGKPQMAIGMTGRAAWIGYPYPDY